MAPKVVSDELQRCIKTIYDDCMLEDTAVRERQIRKWRRLKLLWEGFNRVWYSEIAHDWRIWDETADEQTDQSYYDKPINVFKAYLESIIAALSVTVPPIKCFPDNADNPLDLATAKAGDKIAQLNYRHNNAPMLWLHSLFVSVTEGLVAMYHYPVEDKEYGTYEKKEHDETAQEYDIATCPSCGHELSSTPVAQGMNNPAGNSQNPNQPADNSGAQPDVNKKLQNAEKDEFQPDDEDAPLHYALNEGQDLCPACMAQMDPAISREKLIVTRLTGITTEAKTRVCTEVYGGLNVKIPNFTRRQKDLPYLIFEDEADRSMVQDKYNFILKKKGKEQVKKNLEAGGSSNSQDQYSQWGRLSPQYQGEYPINVVTINKIWIRPGKFYFLSDEKDITAMKKAFPDGCHAVFINDEFVEACNESLDDCWTLTENPLSDYLHFEPAGEGLVSIQDITNDLISLTLQTIEHGIGQTFADPEVLNFNGYAQTEVTPGGIFPAKPKSGKAIGDGFYELKTATLSPEVMPFGASIQSLAQLTSGALPSLFGGQIEGSDTASEYSMSRSQALQRLQNTYKVTCTWWKTCYSKIVPMQIENIQEDERDVQQDNDGNFINVLIRKAELEGRIGKVELESSDALPITWMQRRDVIEKMLMSGNPQVMGIIGAPENAALLHEYLGLVDFYVPGEDDIIKQYDEIKQLLNSTPIQQPTDPMLIQQAVMAGQPPPPPMIEVSSVPIDPLYDNHKIEFEIVRKWAIGEAGRQTKVDNPEGYKNVLLHGKEHFDQMQAQMMTQPPPVDGQGDGSNPEKPNTLNRQAPITGDNNVPAIH